MKRLVIASTLIGIMVFLFFFTLSGGTLQSIPTKGFNLETMWLILAGIFSAASSLFIGRAQIKLAKFEVNNNNSHDSIFDILGAVKEKYVLLEDVVYKMVSESNKQEGYKRSLLNAQNEYVAMVGWDVDPTENLQDFAIHKAKHFRDFVNGVQELGFADISPKGLLDSGEANSRATRIKCEELMGLEFSNIFYRDHEARVAVYLRDLNRIIGDGDNSKADRVHEKSIAFLKCSIQKLLKTYMKLNKLDRGDGK